MSRRYASTRSPADLAGLYDADWDPGAAPVLVGRARGAWCRAPSHRAGPARSARPGHANGRIGGRIGGRTSGHKRDVLKLLAVALLGSLAAGAFAAAVLVSPWW